MLGFDSIVSVYDTNFDMELNKSVFLALFCLYLTLSLYVKETNVSNLHVIRPPCQKWQPVKVSQSVNCGRLPFFAELR